MLNNTLLIQLKHKISFAETLIILGIFFSTTSFSQRVRNSDTSVNLVSDAPILYSRFEDGALITNSVPLIANASSYVRSGNNIVVQTSWRWSNGIPVAFTTIATQELRINGVTYARLTTTNGYSTTGTFQLLSGKGIELKWMNIS